MIPNVEDPGNARAGFPGTHHVCRGASTKEQAQRVDHDGFAAAGFASQQVESAVKMDSQALDHGIVFDNQLLQHAAIIAWGGNLINAASLCTF